MKSCPACNTPFTPIVRARPISGLPWESKVCASCALSRILDACAESVAEMSDEEIDAELRAEGVDVEAFLERTRAQIDALTKEKP